MFNSISPLQAVAAAHFAHSTQRMDLIWVSASSAWHPVRAALWTRQPLSCVHHRQNLSWELAPIQ